ncbi:pyruvate dehydrogenase [acetyl-transferring]-phosphatase 1, mitochondrial-like [Acipenser oxyrinchus oxyrinchus]|uniref:[Pyruvate dehydrogenase [acetyl-transferring]]-phosphatase 2, mitochondrial n=1 Tax=Acipenser oxyrinchus oxyrinchus TaxID=40147 RepID=A0AAD8CVS9_ACIOX|nr:pyruvate dehydrogenase [acetyl-transferring]-phosphatase 1, mitochondrial-like [Acipenser oxyrinchus oxyrinchus]
MIRVNAIHPLLQVERGTLSGAKSRLLNRSSKHIHQRCAASVLTWACSHCAPVSVTPYRQYRSKAHSSQLTLAQMNRILKANEYSYKVHEYDGRNVSSVLGFDSNLLASNVPVEDRRSAATCLQSRGMLFGVFDGHAGYACAQAVSERLFYYIAVSLLPLKTLIDIEEAVENKRPVFPILHWHKHPNDEVNTAGGKLYFSSLRTYWRELIELAGGDQTGTEAALANAFKRLDNDISLEAQLEHRDPFSQYTPLRVAISGSTACVAHVDAVDLHVANLGDSRAVLGVHNHDGTWTAQTMSNDHSAQNPEEVKRVLSQHPKSEEKTVIRHDRLLGLLMPFRAFGDIKFKWSSGLQNSVFETRAELLSGIESTKSLLTNYHTPPYLTAEPEITYHRLRPQDKFLVLATDGLWEQMHRQTVVRVIGEHLTGIRLHQPLSGLSLTLGQMHILLAERKAWVSSGFDHHNTATHLIRHALGSDEFGKVEHSRLSKMLSLPQELARMYRDDITVTVVHFNPQIIQAHYKG